MDDCSGEADLPGSVSFVRRQL